MLLRPKQKNNVWTMKLHLSSSFKAIICWSLPCRYCSWVFPYSLHISYISCAKKYSNIIMAPPLRRSARLTVSVIETTEIDSVPISSTVLSVKANADGDRSIKKRVAKKRTNTPQIKVDAVAEDLIGTKHENSPTVTPSPAPRKKARKAICTAQETPTASTKVGASKKSPKRSSPPPPAPGSKKAPAGWEEIYALVEELRRDKTAPVDDAGAEALPERSKGENVYRFQVLVALMLSSQTKDAVVGEAVRNLQKHGLTVENIANTSHEQLNELIQKVGFHNNKTKYIKQTVEILLEKYNGDIPKTAQEMIDDLPGVGPKMAYLVETIAWKTSSGIGIDTHMHRIFNQISWVNNTKSPEHTRVHLEAWLPGDKWATVNYLWVGFGQEVQQFKPKVLKKALGCSRPLAALKLLKRVGLDPVKEGEKLGLGDEVRAVLYPAKRK